MLELLILLAAIVVLARWLQPRLERARWQALHADGRFEISALQFWSRIQVGELIAVTHQGHGWEGRRLLRVVDTVPDRDVVIVEPV